MKILFLGDYSNYHHTLATALLRMGHDVTVASNGSRWMDTSRDIDISRPFSSKLGGALLWLKLSTLLNQRLKGYDIVQINNPVFIDQRPNRVRQLFERLRRDNGSVFMTAMGTDSYFVEMATAVDSKLRYSEWQINGTPGPICHKKDVWLNPLLANHCRYIYDNIDGVITALYEYDLAVRRILPAEMVCYGGIPIDTASTEPMIITESPSVVNLFLGMHRDRKQEKGTDRIEIAAKAVAKKHSDYCRLEIVENLPYNEYLKRLCNAHVVLDQLYSYTPATNALLAMAMGHNVVSGAEPEYYEFIGEKENHPIINALPDDEVLFSTIENIVLHHDEIPSRSKMGRDFVVKHNDSAVVAQRFVDFWEKRIK